MIPPEIRGYKSKTPMYGGPTVDRGIKDIGLRDIWRGAQILQEATNGAVLFVAKFARQPVPEKFTEGVIYTADMLAHIKPSTLSPKGFIIEADAYSQIQPVSYITPELVNSRFRNNGNNRFIGIIDLRNFRPSARSSSMSLSSVYRSAKFRHDIKRRVT